LQKKLEASPKDQLEEKLLVTVITATAPGLTKLVR
jgi:hypothetical protein